MSLGQHAVVVEPSRYLGPPKELAERLAPVLRVPASKVSEMLERGALTIDADLDESSAQRLFKRLDGLGIPAAVRTLDGTTIRRTADPDDPRASGPTPAPSSGNESPATDLLDDAWGTVLPEIAGEARPPGSPETDSEPVAIDDRTASLLAEFEESARQTDERWRELPEPAKSVPPPTPPSLDELEQRPAKPAPVATDRPTQLPSSGPRKNPNPPKADTQTPGLPDRKFDASRLSAALTRDDSNRAPYAPKGFDAAPPHLPGLAAGLSALAPGAGQIYNGDDEDALDYGLKFFLILPWIQSVKDAKKRGEKVATYWLPRPDDGALFRSLKYLFVWWLAVGAILATTGFIASWAWKRATAEPVVEITEAEIATAMEDAQTSVRLGRIAAMRELSIAQLDVPQKRFTMTDEERAERLFIIGHQHCRNGNFGGCEAIMKRVASLKMGNAGKAFRLQAWASAARSGNTGKFPEVGDVRTLSDFEAESMSKELGVPKPENPEPPPQNPATLPDAGNDASSPGEGPEP